MESIRERVIREAMCLFGERGYAATTIEQIERASGFSVGSGSIYRHVRSKEALLVAGVETHLKAAAEITGQVEFEDHRCDLSARARAVSRVTIRRMDAARDLIRLLLREHDRFPEVLGQVRDQLMTAHHGAVARWLRAQPELEGLSDEDARSRAAAIVAAVSHYWFLRDSFGATPFGVEESDFLTAVEALVLVPVPPAETG